MHNFGFRLRLGYLILRLVVINLDGRLRQRCGDRLAKPLEKPFFGRQFALRLGRQCLDLIGLRLLVGHDGEHRPLGCSHNLSKLTGFPVGGSIGFRFDCFSDFVDLSASLRRFGNLGVASPRRPLAVHRSRRHRAQAPQRSPVRQLRPPSDSSCRSQAFRRSRGGQRSRRPYPLHRPRRRRGSGVSAISEPLAWTISSRSSASMISGSGVSRVSAALASRQRFGLVTRHHIGLGRAGDIQGGCLDDRFHHIRLKGISLSRLIHFADPQLGQFSSCELA